MLGIARVVLSNCSSRSVSGISISGHNRSISRGRDGASVKHSVHKCKTGRFNINKFTTVARLRQL